MANQKRRARQERALDTHDRNIKRLCGMIEDGPTKFVTKGQYKIREKDEEMITFLQNKIDKARQALINTEINISRGV